MQPHPPPAEPGPQLDARLARWLRLAWAALAWELLWPLILPPLCLVGVFAALALFDVLPLLPGWLHALVLAGLAGGIAFLLTRAFIRFRAPGADPVARRLERDSGLSHRPLAALSDRPVGDDPVAEALWQAHRRRMAAAIDRLRVALPHPNMAARDPWGLRAAVLLLLVIAGVGGWHDASKRLARALIPAIQGPGLGPDALEVWITPPSYTGLAPILLKPGQPQGVVALPAGSAVLAVLSGGWGTAHLRVDESDTAFQRQGDGSQRLETRLDGASRLEVRQSGLSVAAWPIKVVPDALPSIAFTMPPEPGERGRLRLTASASDDYGLAKAWVAMRRMGASPDEPPFVFELALPAARPRAADIAVWQDLTAHPWAGLPVSLQPVAEDALGQQGAGEPHTLTLPERDFLNPVAAAIVAERRRLTEDRGHAPQAMALLDRVASEPALFNDDLKTFLMLRAARHGLAEPQFDLAEMQELLWNAALRIEEGDLASAEQAMADARKALEKAMEENAPASELQRLLDQFQQAMQRYVQALAERMAETGQPPPQANAEGRTITDEELAQMVEGMRDMAQSGSRDALRQMMDQLSQILDGLQAGAQNQAQPNGPAAEGMRQLRDLAKRQQDMLDHSHRQAQQPSASQGDPRHAAEAQKGLQRGLGEVTRKLDDALGDAPISLGEAARSMMEATEQLGEGAWEGAAEAQGRALQALQQASREAMAQMAASGQGGAGMLPRDPLGRPAWSAGTGDDGTTRVPDRSEVQRSRDLLDEIRRRAGEFHRPEPERDYLHRLLKQF